jgi:hypothetical protein
MDLDACKRSGNMRNKAAKRLDAVGPQPVREVVEPHGVETGIAKEDLHHAPGGRIPLEDDSDVVAD